MRFLGIELGIHPRAMVHSLLTYPRYLGTIKPDLLGKSEAETRARLAALGLAWLPKQLECPLGRRLLVLAPHPDDESIGAGGLLLQHRGIAEIHLVSLFNGERGGRLERGEWQSDPGYRAELVTKRRQEFEQVAARLRVSSVQHLGLPDSAVVPDLDIARMLRKRIDAIRPDVVLLPWFLDRHRDHRVTNILYAWACADWNCAVLSFEVWAMLQPNTVLDITDCLAEKLELVQTYQTQTATLDYLSMVRALASLRAISNPVRPQFKGAVEAYFALPNSEYCDLVTGIYGPPGCLHQQALPLL